MSEYDIDNALASDLNAAETSFSVDTANTDAAGDGKETSWVNPNWKEQLGFYKNIPELKAAIDAIANWTIGLGVEANEITMLLLMNIKGNGKDVIDTILENMVRVYQIGGDSFAEIIRDTKGYLINIKPLDPSSIKTIQNRNGLIIRYEQVSKNKLPNKKYKPSQIFHLSRNRVADEIHGESIIDAVEEIILSRNEAMADYKKVLHRNVAPMKIHYLNTGSPTKIATYKAMVDAAGSSFENLYVPMDETRVEVLSIPPNATLNPIQWINNMTQYFYQACNCPQVIMGGSVEITDAAVKMTYFAFEQVVKKIQRFIVNQFLSQLNLEITLIPPASLQNDMISGNQKDGNLEQAESNDTTAEVEGRK